jgi:hypothetical protein
LELLLLTLTKIRTRSTFVRLSIAFETTTFVAASISASFHTAFATWRTLLLEGTSHRISTKAAATTGPALLLKLLVRRSSSESALLHTWTSTLLTSSLLLKRWTTKT